MYKGSTFTRVEVPQRTAVDPNPKIDEAALGPGAHMERRTSDAYFADLSTDAHFDLVFLDGLHTFEQVYRDLTSALLHTGPRSAILIDDTIPNDVYSSLNDFSRSVAARQAAGNTGGGWHGDVYKVVFAIHDFHLELSYATIIGSGNPQTLVWRGREPLRTPRFDSLEAISRLSYFDLPEHDDVINRAAEPDALQRCLEDLTGL